MSTRRYARGASPKYLIDSYNYTDYTVTKTGTGASGTWGINVTGTAAKFNSNRTIALTGDTTGSVSGDGSSGWSISTTTTKMANLGRIASPDIQINDTQLSKMTYALASSSMTTNKPPIGDGYILTFGWDNGGWASQIAISHTKTPHMVIRGAAHNTINNVGNRSDWGNWIYLLDANNYTDYTVTKTGTGASGTWGINISGTATKATQDGDGNTISSTYLKLSGGTMTGTITMPRDKEGLHFPSNNSNYGTGLIYGVHGNEALAIVTKMAVTNFMVVHGSDPASWGQTTWISAAPTIQTKNKSLYVNELIGNGVTPSYNFKVSGTSYLGGDVKISHNNADTESVKLSYNSTLKCLNFTFAA